MAPYVRRILLRVHAPGSAGGCEEQQERRCAPRYGSVHFSATDFCQVLDFDFPSVLQFGILRTVCSVSTESTVFTTVQFRPVW